MNQRRKVVIDGSLKSGEILEGKDVLFGFLAIGSVRATLIALAVMGVLVSAIFAIQWRNSFSTVASAVDVISRTVNTTRKLYAGRLDVGESSVLLSVLLSRPYEEGTVRITWLESGLVDVRNQFGGRIDIVGLKDHFEVKFDAVPADICAKIAVEMAPTKMPLFINTLHFAGPFTMEQANKACYAEFNNMAYKFR